MVSAESDEQSDEARDLDELLEFLLRSSRMLTKAVERIQSRRRERRSTTDAEEAALGGQQ